MPSPDAWRKKIDVRCARQDSTLAPLIRSPRSFPLSYGGAEGHALDCQVRS